MPEDQPHHRFARAAGKATRAFMDTSKEDAERIRTERGRLAEQQEQRRAAAQAEEAAAQRAAAERRAATPATLKAARWWWTLATAIFALIAVAFLLAGLNAPAGAAGGIDAAAPESTPTGQFVLAGLAGVLAVASGIGTVQLLRSRRSAAGLLTGVAVLVGVPLIIRGHPALIALAAVLLAGAALLWWPAVRRSLR